MSELKSLMPKTYNRYFEPFMGGGALFFEIKPENAIINDYNKELINLYKVVKTNPSELINDMSRYENNAEYYYKIRALDRDEVIFKKLTAVQKASRFLYLNRSGFNGLYRVNKKGQCNVPFGRYRNPKYCDPDNIMACSKLFSKTEILNGDFKIIKDKIKKEDFVYFDPPYAPISVTASFTGYTEKGFDKNMQLELRELCDYIDSIKGYFMLSNSYCDFILDLYDVNGYNIHIVKAKRNINSNGNGRGKIKEVIITNY